jgi:hypothetical protein
MPLRAWSSSPHRRTGAPDVKSKIKSKSESGTGDSCSKHGVRCLRPWSPLPFWPLFLLAGEATKPRPSRNRNPYTRRLHRSRFRVRAGRAPGSWGPFAAVRRGRQGPQGGRQGRLPLFARAGSPVEKPGPASRTRRAGCPESAASGCSFFWLLFFEQAKKSDSASGRRAKHAAGDNLATNHQQAKARRRRARSRQNINQAKAHRRPTNSQQPNQQKKTHKNTPPPHPSDVTPATR